MELPVFKYHSDPVKSLTVKKSNVECICCGLSRGFIYTGPAYSLVRIRKNVCPWCIADGSAREKFEVEFNDPLALSHLPKQISEEVTYRTPGFSSWQQGSWWTHCNDAGVFLGYSSAISELTPAEEETLINHLLQDSSSWRRDEWHDYFKSPEEGTSVEVYIFRCPQCGEVGGYSDCS